MCEAAVDQSNSDAIRILEVFSRAAGVEFDRALASRTLSEAQRAIPGSGSQVWSRRLEEVAESLHLRVITLESTLAESLVIVRQGTPVATCVEHSDGRSEWFILTEAGTRRVRLASIDPTAEDRWLSASKLPRTLGIPNRKTPLRWIVGQQALPCDSGANHHEGHSADHEPSALARLARLMRPEWKDIRVILVFSFVVGLLNLAVPITVESLVNTVAFGRYFQPIVVLAIILFTFLVFAAAMRGLLAYIGEVIQRRMFIRVVEDLAYRLPRTKQTAFDESHGPELVNRFFDIVTLQKVVAMLLLDGIGIVLQTTVGMLVLAFYHPFLLGFDVVLLALIAFVIFGLGRGAVTTAVQESRAKYAVAAWLQELVRHPTAFKLHGGAQFGMDRADHLAVDWLQARRAHFHVVMRQILFALGVQAVAATVLLGLGGWLVVKGQLTLGQLVAAELIVMLIVSSFAKLGKYMESFYDMLASVEKLGIIFDLPIEEHDNLFHLRDGSPARLALRQVAYQFGEEPILRNVSLQLQSGERVALVGPPGCGKSTLLDLVCSMRQPASGYIELDGIDLRELRPDSLREHVALTRGPEIFHGTIDENVHLNRPRISALDVRDAMSAVGLLDEVMQLPDGLNTAILTDGAPLSASQSLRLMLARAIVDRPRLLLIDGTLDGLPDDVQEKVLAGLARPGSPWTLLVATGRQSVIDACQRVVSLAEGECHKGISRRD
jgi:ABC-type bacteriocin/lantibiotic exporter with double-glycine peptidase domain